MLGAQSPEGWAAIAAWVTAIGIGIGLGIALGQVREARRLREARIRPFVVVDLEAEYTLIHLTVENLGLLPARDVKLRVVPPLKATRDDPWPPEASTLMTRGIPTLPPGKKYRFFFDTFPERVKADLPLTYEAHLTYKATGRKDPFEELYTLDLSFLKGVGEARRKTLHNLTEAVEQVGKTVARWGAPGNGVLVHTVDHETYERERLIRLAIQDVARKLEAGEGGDARTALVAALHAIGESGDPPDHWVKAIEEGKNFRFSATELDGGDT